MNEIAAALNTAPSLTVFWRIVSWASAAYLIWLGLASLARPALAARFLKAHAATPTANATEAGLRLLVGLSFMGVSTASRAPDVFFWFGALLAATAPPMVALHRLHQRYAAWSVPLAIRALPALGVGALGLGGVVCWGLR